MDGRRARLVGMSLLVMTLACGPGRGALTTDDASVPTSGAAGTASVGAAGTSGMTVGAAGTTAFASGAAGTSSGAAGTTIPDPGMPGAAGTTGATVGAAGSTPGGGGPSCLSGDGAALDAGVDAGAGGGPGSATTPNGLCVAGAFKHNGVCLCQDVVPTVCGEACTDLTTDADNCGACGHRCPATSTCNAGRCGPVVTPIVAAVPDCDAMSIVVGNGMVFYADTTHGTVRSVPVGCGTTTLISAVESSPTHLTLAGAALYWINSIPGPLSSPTGSPTTKSTIRVQSAPGAAVKDLVTETNASDGIAGLAISADGRSVYYSADTKIRMIPAAGGAPTDVVHEERGGLPGALALVGETLAYPTALNGDVDVVTLKENVVASCGNIDPSTGELGVQVNCTRLARSQGALLITAMILRNGSASWANGASIASNDAHPGAPQSNLQLSFTALSGTITALTSSPTSLFFTEDGAVEKSAFVPNSTPVLLARAQPSPTSIAVDATRVYWSTSDCAVNATGL